MERKSAYETQSQRNCCKNNGTDLTGQHLYPVQSAESANCHCADLCSRMVELIFCSGGRIEHHHRYCTGTESQAADRKADAFVPVECQNRTERRTALCSHCRSAGTGYSAPGKRQPDLRRCRCHRRRHRGQRVPAHRRIGCSLQKGRRFPAVRQFCYQRHLPCHCPPCGQ